jgi:cytochrome P450
LDVSGDIDRHLSFGFGIHFCVGASLARMEGRIGLEERYSVSPAGTSMKTVSK